MSAPPPPSSMLSPALPKIVWPNSLPVRLIAVVAGAVDGRQRLDLGARAQRVAGRAVDEVVAAAGGLDDHCRPLSTM